MENVLIRNISSAASILMLAGVSALGLSACSHARKAPSAQSGPVAGAVQPESQKNPVEGFGPPEPPPQYGPEPVQIRSVTLVLGSGMARGFAYIGAIRALNEAHIQIAAVLGTEMGGLIGALYAVDGNINHLEWSLMRLKPELFVEKEGFLSKVFHNKNERSKLESELTRVFGKRDIRDSKVPLRIALELRDSKTPVVVDHGEFVPALRAALAKPGLLKEGIWDGVPAISAEKSRPFLVGEAKVIQAGPVLVIDASGVPEERSAADLKDADLVIRPDLRNVSASDFEKRNEIAFKGKLAVQSRISEIKRLVGMPVENSESKNGDGGLSQ